MIQTEELKMIAPRRAVSVKVLQGGQRGLDIRRFAEALTMLESYVDGMLAATELPAMDSWVDDEVMDVRLTSL
jgi:hypothetical protein